MSNKLLALDLALATLAVMAGMHVRRDWLEAHKRAGVIVGLPLKPAAAPPYSPAPPAPQPMAADYVDVAQQMLFSSDRNPNVIVEVKAPKPVPKLPELFGVMNLGAGMIAIMSAGDDRRKEVHPGQKIGEFQLVSVDREHMVLEWDGKQITKKLAELIAKVEAPAAPAAQARNAPAAAAPAPKVVVAAAAAPGEDMGAGVKRCVQGDSSPAGTVVDGMKKVITSSPFGPICRWESIR